MIEQDVTARFVGGTCRIDLIYIYGTNILWLHRFGASR